MKLIEITESWIFQGHDRSRRSSLSSRAGSVEQAETGSRVSQDSIVTSQSTIEPELRTEPVVPKQAKELGRIRFQIQLKLVTDTSLCTLQVSGVTRWRVGGGLRVTQAREYIYRGKVHYRLFSCLSTLSLGVGNKEVKVMFFKTTNQKADWQPQKR